MLRGQRCCAHDLKRCYAVEWDLWTSPEKPPAPPHSTRSPAPVPHTPYQMALVALMFAGVSMGVLDIDYDMWTPSLAHLPPLPHSHAPPMRFLWAPVASASTGLPLGAFSLRMRRRDDIREAAAAHTASPLPLPRYRRSSRSYTLLEAAGSRCSYWPSPGGPTPAPPTRSQKAPALRPASSPGHTRLFPWVLAIECDP
ncbi:hypothetical protein M422DRAFT_245794 [Sphaerobolus stellatus SS14]|nr:hypothetical protein M422DRAFT_245794 [Sphaerobolus stellatus SS14]